MSRIHTSMFETLAVGVLLVVVPVAAGSPTIGLLEDSGQAIVEAWFEGVGEPVRHSGQGPSSAGLNLQADSSFLDELGRPSEVTARGSIAPPAGTAEVSLYAAVEPAGMTLAGRGWARTDLTWHIAVGTEPVPFRVSLWATGGSSGLYLYEQATGRVVVDTGAYEGFGTSLSGQLEPGRTYRLEGYTLADGSLGGDPHAGLEFRADATIVSLASVPEPVSAALLMTGLGWPAWSALRRQISHAQR